MDDNASLISFIVPVYNAEKYVERCLKSICEQTYTNLEIIVVDDGSIDTTCTIVKEHFSNEPRVKLYSKRNEGVSATRNYALDRANGAYICFVDADDWIDKTFAEDNYKIMCNGAFDIIINNYCFADKSEVIWHTLKKDKGIVNVDSVREEFIISDLLNSVCTNFYCASIIQENGIRFPTQIKYGEDKIFNLNYIDHIKNAYYTNKAYYHYEMHAGSGCRHLHGNQLSMYETQFEIKKTYMKKWNLESKENKLQLLQLAGTHLAGFALMAQREFARHGYYKWLNELYGMYCFRELEENKHSLSYKSVPRSYRILLRCLLGKRNFCAYVYCKALNGLL